MFSPVNGTKFAFGDLPIGQSQQKTFTFTNSGSDTLFLRSLELSSDSGFTIQFATLTLPPKGTGKVVVQFSPKAEHSYKARLSFVTANGVSAPTVQLSGNGIVSDSSDAMALKH